MKGRSHEAQALPVGGLLSLALLPMGIGEASLFATGYALGTLYLSPDLDLRESRPSRRWGPLSLLWEPYRLLHPHRGASHTYLYGPLSRLGYLFLLLWPLVSLGLLPPVSLPQEWALPLLLGYLASQWTHLVQDGIHPIRLIRRRRPWRTNAFRKW